MKRTLKRTLALVLALVMVLGMVPAMAAEGNDAADSIVLADQTGAAPIYIDHNSPAYDGLSLIAEAVAGDIEAVTGKRPQVVTQEPATGVMIIAGVVDETLITSQDLTWAISASGESFKSEQWERYQIQVKEGEGKTKIVVAGADKRGVIYGLFHITQDLGGVSPWIWWADAKPARQETLSFTKAELETVSKRPSVNYRGFFLNDENPCLDGFADSHFGGLNYMFYDHVFELMLRLKGNFLWPAMWSNNFNLDGMEGVTGEFAELEKEYHSKLGGVMYIDQPGHGDETGIVDINALGGEKIDNGTGYFVDGEYPMSLANAVLADRYGVVVGASHHEPMARAGQEWGRFKHTYYKDPADVQGGDVGVWNYLLNPTNISKFWSDAIARNGGFDNLLTIGMRGENDSALQGADGHNLSTEENTELLKQVLKKQDELLGKFGLQATPQLIALYKEVENCWYGGSRNKPAQAGDFALRKDAEVTSLLGKDTNRIVMLCEDNNGYLRTLPELEEKDKFNWGMYYHFDYVGGPRTSMWLNTMPLQRTWDNMTMAYDYGVDDAWIVNVGDLKPMELPLSYFLDMAYDFETYGSANPNSAGVYTLSWARQQFRGANLTEADYQAIAQLLTDYTDMNGQCKPETLLSSGDPSYSVLHYNEAQEHLAKAEDIMARADALLENLPKGSALYDAFYELVYYPAVASANVNRVQIFQGLNQLYAKRGSTMANVYADLVTEGLAYDEELTAVYNALGGDLNGKAKWYGMMWTTPDYVGKTPNGKDTKPHMNYSGWNAESAGKIKPTYVEGTPGGQLIVDVPGVEQGFAAGATATLPDFESIVKQAYAVTLSNGGSEAMEYEVTNSHDWIKIAGDLTGRFYTGTTLGVSVDWSKVTGDQTGSFTVSSGEQTVTVTVNAKVVDTSANVDDKTFFPSQGEISIVSNQFADRGAAVNGVQWTELEGYGKAGATMKLLPTHTAPFAAGEGPWLDYKVYVPQAGDYRLTLYVGQSNNVSFDQGTHLNVGLQVDGGAVGAVNALPGGYVAGDNGAQWGSSIMRAGRTVSTDLNLTAGEHTLRLYGMDHNLLLQKLVLTKGKNNPKSSLLGPRETYCKAMGEAVQKELIHYTGLKEVMTLPGTIAASDCGNQGATVENGLLQAQPNVTYTYPVKVVSGGNFLFNLVGKSGSGATATLKIGNDTRTFALGTTEAVVESSQGVELDPGDYTVELTVSAAAQVRSWIGEIYDATEGRLVTLTGAGGDPDHLNRAMDRKKSTSWQPDGADPTLTLDLGETAYADHFILTGSFGGVTGYRLEASADGGTTWTQAYESDTRPVSGQKVYFQGTQAFKGDQWRFSFTGRVDALTEVALNTFVNWALADGEKTYTTGGKDPNRPSSDPVKTGDGNRIGHPKTKNGWIAEAGNLTISFDKYAHPMTGVYIVAMQKSVDDGSDGVIPTDTLGSSQAPGKYNVSYQTKEGDWVSLGDISNGGPEGNKVLNYVEFADGEAVYVRALKIDINGWVRVMEIEPVDVRRYTIGGTAAGWPEDSVEIAPVEEPADDPAALGYINLARLDGVSVTLTGEYEGKSSDSDGARGARLVDGILVNDELRVRWEAVKITAEQPASVILDLGREQNVHYVEVVSQRSNGVTEDPNRTMETNLGLKAMTVSYWDGAQWVQAGAVQDNKLVWNQFKLDQPVKTGKIKLDFPASAATSGWLRVFETLVWGEEIIDDGLTNFALTGTVTVSPGEGNSAPAVNRKLNDGIIASSSVNRWRTDKLPAYAEVDLGAKRVISVIDVISQMNQDGTPTMESTTTLGLKQIEISAWNGNGWRKVVTGAANNTKVWQHFVLEEPVVTEKIRIDIPVGSTMDSWARLIEIQVKGSEWTEPVTWAVTIDNTIANGRVSADKTEAEAGETVTLTVTPETGYHLKAGSLKVYKTDDSSTTVPVEDNKFTMPNHAVTVTAAFEADAQAPVITGVTVSPEAVTVQKGTTQQFAANVTGENDYSKDVIWSVSVRPVEPAQVEMKATEFSEGSDAVEPEQEILTGDPAEAEGGDGIADSVKPVSEPVDGEAIAEPLSEANPAELALGTTISETGLLTVAADETAATLIVTATAKGDETKYAEAIVTVSVEEVTRYTLTVNKGTGSGDYAAGTEITVTADEPEAGKRFKEWMSVELDLGKEATANPLTITMPAESVTLTATYEDIPVDTAALEAAIAAAEAAKRGVSVRDEAPSSVPSGTRFVSTTVMAALDEAIETAKAAKDAAESQEAVNDAASALNGAVETFKAAIQTGTYVSSGGSSGSSSGNKTKTEKHPDGSVTTTVTKPNGTVTETTKRPDGTTEVRETRKDGTVTETVTRKDGFKSETVTKPDGSLTQSVTTSDGVKSETEQDAEGNTTANVTIPEKAAEDGETVPLPIPMVDAAKENTVIVTAPKDAEVKVEVPVKEATAGTVAVIVNEDGTETIVKTSVPTENGLTLTVTGKVTVKIVDNSKEFVDVAAEHWASEAVAFVTSRELFNGTGEDTFDPKATTSRAMLFTVLARLEGVDTKGGETWYAKAMEWAKSTGISDGTMPEASITREQLATMLYRYAGQPAAEGEGKTFTDSDRVSDWAARAMDWAVKTGILTGKDGDRLDPTGVVTRGEVAIMLMRFMTVHAG